MKAVQLIPLLTPVKFRWTIPLKRIFWRCCDGKKNVIAESDMNLKITYHAEKLWAMGFHFLEDLLEVTHQKMRTSRRCLMWTASGNLWTSLIWTALENIWVVRDCSRLKNKRMNCNCITWFIFNLRRKNKKLEIAWGIYIYTGVIYHGNRLLTLHRNLLG